MNDNLQRILSRSPLPGSRHPQSNMSTAISQTNAPTTVPLSHPAAAPANHSITNPVQEGLQSSVNLTQILSELRSLKDEFRKVLSKVQDEQRKMGNALVKALEATFTIENSPYKVHPSQLVSHRFTCIII